MRHCIYSIALFILVLALSSAACAQQLSPQLQAAVGHWQTANGGQVETYLVNGQLFGKVTKPHPGRHPSDVCEKCPGDLKNKPIIGLLFLRGFHPDGNEWAGGTVVDPENGKEYKGKIWAVGNDKLNMRGYISILWRTETWVRIPQ
jgi:uncharacterized protein (DUF2147 family)